MNLFKLSTCATVMLCLYPSLTACKSSSAETVQKIQYSKYLTDQTPRLGIIAAFGQEADLLLESTQNKQEHIIQGRKFTTGLLNNTNVVITISGISMTNAAMTTQMMNDHFQIKGLIFSGIAGSLNPNLHVGDVVIAKSWIAPDEIYYANSENTPSPCGEIGDLSCLGLQLDSSIPPFEQQFLRKTNVINQNNYQQIALTTQINNQPSPVSYGEMKTDFPADLKMLNYVANIQTKTEKNLEAICQSDTKCYQPKIVLGQRGVSGGAFLANTEYRDYLHNKLSGDVVDMETAAVAQVAYSNNIPFIAFRSLSDLAGADHDPNVAAFFGSGIAQRNAAQVTMNFIHEWGIKNNTK